MHISQLVIVYFLTYHLLLEDSLGEKIKLLLLLFIWVCYYLSPITLFPFVNPEEFEELHTAQEERGFHVLGSHSHAHLKISLIADFSRSPAYRLLVSA